MAGMTLKQSHRKRFLELCAAYRRAKERIDTEEGKRDFLVLSVRLHAAKANVPKGWWRMMPASDREE